MLSFEWQEKCLDIWRENNFRGIVNVVTGAGKTYFALSCIKHLALVSEKELSVKIIVPQVFLVSQWIKEMVLHLGISSAEIGVYYGLKKNISGKKYAIYVVNSARYVIAKHILSDMNKQRAVLLIADECHHYCSNENAKIFEFYKHLKPEHTYYSLGLSATPKTVNYKIIENSLGREIFRYSFANALAAQIISEFILINIEVSFTGEEFGEYTDLSGKLRTSLPKLLQACPELKNLSSEKYFAKISDIAKSHKSSDISALAATVLGLLHRRKAIVHTAQEKISCTINLAQRLEEKSKIIIFCERIETAEILYLRLGEKHKRQVGIYHSNMKSDVRKHVLKQYQDSEIRILITCKALDEGLNVPSTDIGIIVSSTGSVRQRIQRLGRVIRKTHSKKRLYYLYVGQSNENEELIDDISGLLPDNMLKIDLQFRKGIFFNSEYQKYCDNVLSLHENKFNKAGLLNDVKRNLATSLVRCDWYQSESSCRKRIASAVSNAERNYWVSILYLILEMCKP